MKTKKSKVIPRALLLKKLAIASKVIKDLRIQIGDMREELKDQRPVYNVSLPLVTIPEYEQRLDDYRFKVETLEAEVNRLTPVELPKGAVLLKEFWDKPQPQSLFQRFLKALGFNG